MKGLFFISVLLLVFNANAQQDSMVFYSSKELNQYRFANTDLNEVTTGYLLDMEEEWTNEQVDSFLYLLKNPVTDVNTLLTILNCLERTDVNFKFERDSLLFPVMDHFYSKGRDRALNLPLFIVDVNTSRLNSVSRKLIDNWTGINAYTSFYSNDFLTEKIFLASFFIDTMRFNNINLYWNEETIISNSDRSIMSIQLTIGSDTIDVKKGEYFNLNPILQNGAINQISLKVMFSDETIEIRHCTIFLSNENNYEDGKITNSIANSIKSSQSDEHYLDYTIYYGCEEVDRLNKPFIMVAGWGPYTDRNLINWVQGWPTEEWQLYQDWNQADVIKELRDAGFDVIIVRFTPPNASIRKNVDKLKVLINTINEQKVAAGSTEENIILGYSAGAMCVRLALQEMEKEHLETNGPHPHTKLYISYDGEHQGAHIPLSVQHATRYLSSYQGGLKVYALNYILNATLSKQLLYYFHSKTGNASNPGQGRDDARSHLLWWHEQANHAKSTENLNDPFSRHNPGYPAFSRNISISNGMNESRYISGGVDHFPYPSNYGHILFEQNNNNRKWKAEFNIPGGNRVFYYQTKPWIGNNWTVVIDAKTSQNCLLLDNAPGGMVFTTDNPLMHVMQQMKKKINLGDPSVYNPHTQFCFTPTVFTHDIRNFTQTNGKMDYSMKQNLLMFEKKSDYEEYLNEPTNENLQLLSSNYFGYPHLAYPYSHYWEATPFDAVFSWSENSEHIYFNTCTRNDLNNHNEEWSREYDEERSVKVKRFVFDEVDRIHAYIQNRQYGWNARNNYVYKATVAVPHIIFVGKEVTQRTNFKEVGFLSNSDVTLRAGDAIRIKPGTHIHSGAIFHALIEVNDYNCISYNGMIVSDGNPGDGSQYNERFLSAEEEVETLEEKKGMVYPNPANGTIHVRHKQNLTFQYQVYNMDGKVIETGVSAENNTTFHLPSGIYIVKIQTHESTETHKVIVR